MVNAQGKARQTGVCRTCQPVLRVAWLAGAIIMLVAANGLWQGKLLLSAPLSVWHSAAPLPFVRHASAASVTQMRWIANDAGNMAKGKALFAVCGACHGTEGEGRQGIGPRLNSDTFLAAASDDYLVRTISKGRSGTTMIPWGASFKAEDIQSIIAYIRSLNPVSAATLDESPLHGDAKRGGELFASICAACHGRTGAGYQETANGTGIGRAAFLNEVSNGYLRYIIKHGKSGTKMRPFAKDSKVAVANLSDQQVEDVIAYLRSQSW